MDPTSPQPAEVPAAKRLVVSPRRPGGSAVTDPGRDELVEEELLVEEISIDGMCGVY